MLCSLRAFSPLKKKRRDMYPKGNAAHPVGFDSPVQTALAVWHNFLKNLNMLG
jgi:hypothetical protein